MEDGVVVKAMSEMLRVVKLVPKFATIQIEINYGERVIIGVVVDEPEPQMVVHLVSNLTNI